MPDPSDSAIGYGMFIMPFHPPSKPLAQCYEEDLELVVLAESLGFSEFWIGEHHTMKYESIVMPEIFIGRALGDTHTIRLGPAPVCVNQHHPAAVASRLAFLDHLSKGRLNLCFGPGSVTADHELYGLDPKASGPMMQESVEMILKLWSSDPPYEIDGKYWKICLKRTVDTETQIGYIHKPYQLPHPPIAIPGMSRDSSTMRWAGAQGFAPFANNLVPGNVLANLWSTYAAGANTVGRLPDRRNYRVARSIFLADSTAEAVQRVRTNTLGNSFEYIGRLFDKGLGRQLLKRDLSEPDDRCGMDYLMSEQIIAGDPAEVVRRLLLLWEENGGFGTLILLGYDWDDKASWVRSMELFAREVMPALNRAVQVA